MGSGLRFAGERTPTGSTKRGRVCDPRFGERQRKLTTVREASSFPVLRRPRAVEVANSIAPSADLARERGRGVVIQLTV
jgi:hypothetical protein